MIVTIQNRTLELHFTPADPTKAQSDVYVEVRHKPGLGEPVAPWSGIRFGLLEAEASRIAQALIEATNTERDRSLAIIESFRADSKPAKPVEAATRKRDPSKPGLNPGSPRFTATQGRYLAFIQRYICKYGVAPAESDMQRHFLVSAPSVNAMMQTLTRRRLISRVPGVARSIRLLIPPEELPKL